MTEPIEFEQLGEYLRPDNDADWNTDAAWTELQSRIRARPARRVLPYAIAALLVLGVGVGVTWQRFSPNASSTNVAGQIYQTGVGERIKVSLSDGSTVELAPASELRVVRINAKERVFALKGEAFFNVVHEEERPFTVQAKQSETRVLGTSFDVDAYDNSRGVKVVVATGRVQLRNKVASGIISRGMAGTLVSNAVAIRSANANDALAWRSGQISFHDERFGDVVTVLQRWYRVDIQIADARLANARVTAFLPQKSLDDVLDLLAETLNARYQRTGSTITFNAK